MSYFTVGIGLAGLAMSAYGTARTMSAEGAAGRASRMSMEAQAGMAEYDAAMQEEVKTEARISGNQQMTARTLQLQRLLSVNLASSATTGTGTDSESFDAISDANKTGAGTDIQNISYKAAQTIDQANAKQVQDRFAANVYRAGGTVAEGAGNMRAMGAAATGGWNLLNNAPNFGKVIGNWFNDSGSGSVTVRDPGLKGAGGPST
jgi:hypothetical protein